jgi:xylulokinase
MAAVVEQCGSAPYPGMSLPLLAWLARERPAEFERVDTVLSCKDWLKYRLTGERTLDPSEATVPYLDRTTGEYEPAVFDRVGLPEAADVLPRLAGPTEVIGHVTEAAADATGLEAGLPVVGGLFDVPASALGSGAAAPGEAAVTLGTSLTHQVLVEGPQEAASGIGMALGLGELWTYAIGSNAGTPGLEWVADTVADEPVEALASLAEPVPVGSEGVLYHPYLSSTGERGPFVDPDARGQFVGLTTEHETAHLVRATYEGLSLAVRDCVEHLPTAVSELRLSGGGSRSPFWCQLIADCLGQPTAVPAGSEVGARGAAVLLALGLGEYPSIEAAVDEMVTIERRYSPREAHVPQYDRLYELYVDVRTGMEPLWSQRAETYRELGTDPES